LSYGRAGELPDDFWKALDSAHRKMTQGAKSLLDQRSGYSSSQLAAAFGDSMLPGIFAEKIHSMLGIKLSNAELGATVIYFDSHSSGHINTGAFLREFYRMGREEQRGELQKQRACRVSHEASRMQTQSRLDNLQQSLLNSVRHSFTSDEKRSGLKKIAQAASHFNAVKQKQYGGLKAFESATAMNASTFREKLKSSLNVYLTAAECAGVIDYIDRDGDGEISTVEFKKFFFVLQVWRQRFPPPPLPPPPIFSVACVKLVYSYLKHSSTPPLTPSGTSSPKGVGLNNRSS
jgi:hypothetical protein